MADVDGEAAQDVPSHLDAIGVWPPDIALLRVDNIDPGVPGSRAASLIWPDTVGLARRNARPLGRPLPGSRARRALAAGGMLMLLRSRWPHSDVVAVARSSSWPCVWRSRRRSGCSLARRRSMSRPRLGSEPGRRRSVSGRRRSRRAAACGRLEDVQKLLTAPRNPACLGPLDASM